MFIGKLWPVNIELVRSEFAPLENQNSDATRWSHIIEMVFSRKLPTTTPAISAALHKVLRTEGDELLIGQFFVSVRTNMFQKYDNETLAHEVCAAYGLRLGKLVITVDEEA